MVSAGPRRFGLNDSFSLSSGPSAFGPLVLDRLSSRPSSFWSFARRGTRRWDGPVGRLHRTSDGVEIDMYGRGRWGLVDPNEIRAFNGWNLLRNSSNFPLGGWSSVGVIYTTGLQGPTGEMDAIKVAYDTNSNLKRFSQSITLAVGQTYCSSIYAKADPVDTVVVRNSTNTSSITWNLTSGTVTSHIGTTYASPMIESVGGGWFRLSFTHVAPVTPDNFCWWGRAVASSIGDGVGGTLFARAQVEVGASPSDYRATGTTADADSLWTKLYDQTGAGRHFEQASNLIMPYACRQGVPVTENGIQSAQFVAADARRMAVPSSQSLYNFLHTTGGSVHALSRVNDTASSKRLLSNKASASHRGFEALRGVDEIWGCNTGRIDVAGVATFGNSIDATFPGTALTTQTHALFTVDPDAASAGDRLFGWQNGVEISDNNSSSGSPFVESANGNLTLGARSDGSLPFDGTITELGIWESLIVSGDRGLLWSDASSLWVL